MKKELTVLLPRKEYKIDINNKIISYKEDTFIYSGYNNIPKQNCLSQIPPFFSAIKIFSIVLPIKEFKKNNENFYFCLYKDNFILIPSEHLHALDNKYKYICSN